MLLHLPEKGTPEKIYKLGQREINLREDLGMVSLLQAGIVTRTIHETALVSAKPKAS